MQPRVRIAASVLAALALHLGVRALIDDTALRVRPVAPALPRRAVEIALWSAPAPAAPEPDRPPRPVGAPPAAPRLEVDTPPPEPAAPPLPRHPEDDVAPVAESSGGVGTAPVAEPAPAPLPAPLPGSLRPRSLLERVLAGSSAGPLPSLDVLDPSRRSAPETDAARARRKIQALASAASARGAPPTDAGMLVEQLEPLPGGGYRYETGGFVATIDVDGSVSFIDKDTHVGALSSGLPGRDPTNPFEPYGPAIEPWARPDGTPVARVMGAPVADNSATLGSGSFDPTAALLRAAGTDPYGPEKLCFLEETLPLRADLRAAHERVQLAGLRLHLERLWFDDARPAAERR
ncbi:MAG: hypothetical protein IT382_01895, partial [Deltaproteobacteria bacterium]|nr:hypothetical protein [Deltaproteobacteria bacterium]